MVVLSSHDGDDRAHLPIATGGASIATGTGSILRRERVSTNCAWSEVKFAKQCLGAESVWSALAAIGV